MSAVKLNRDGNRRTENGYMFYYQQAADQSFWKGIWLQDVTPDYYKPYHDGHLFNFEKIFKHHLPKDARILEVGCGTAQPVIAINSNGYNFIGLDYAINAMWKVRQVIGSLHLIFENLISVGISNI